MIKRNERLLGRPVARASRVVYLIAARRIEGECVP
jgi:hypothetical protein